MNNEPVAWMVNGKAYADIFEAEHYSKFTNKPMIPLYTHPHPDNLGLALSIIDQQKLEIEALKKNLDVALMIVNEPAKTLTDEEIDEIVMKQFGESRYDFFVGTWRDFARAILRKAQEK